MHCLCAGISTTSTPVPSGQESRAGGRVWREVQADRVRVRGAEWPREAQDLWRVRARGDQGGHFRRTYADCPSSPPSPPPPPLPTFPTPSPPFTASQLLFISRLHPLLRIPICILRMQPCRKNHRATWPPHVGEITEPPPHVWAISPCRGNHWASSPCLGNHWATSPCLGHHHTLTRGGLGWESPPPPTLENRCWGSEGEKEKRGEERGKRERKEKEKREREEKEEK